MGFLDGILGGVVGAEALSLVSGFIENHGGLEGVIAQLEQSGLGEQVRSWAGPGANLPISAEQIEQALGNEKIQALAAQFGIPVDKVSGMLAEHLPKAVDAASQAP